MSANWKSLTDPNLPVTLKYPDPTPQGFPVRVNVRQGAGYRVHLVSDGSAEVYFEVGRYPGLPVDQGIREFVADVTGRLEGLEVDDITESRFRSSPARRFCIRWPGRERVILFVERDDALYRIIQDPQSPLNREILETFEFL